WSECLREDRSWYPDRAGDSRHPWQEPSRCNRESVAEDRTRKRSHQRAVTSPSEKTGERFLLHNVPARGGKCCKPGFVPARCVAARDVTARGKSSVPTGAAIQRRGLGDGCGNVHTPQ